MFSIMQLDSKFVHETDPWFLGVIVYSLVSRLHSRSTQCSRAVHGKLQFFRNVFFLT